ncbi:hypothetical protein F7Q91_24580 [Vibrio chagasii]|uniref:Uncharacterized protein n=1 Tax=Vibrio chagasii TaxID=170679 RepID=A0A7V7TE60_9VIBR|nr:hypothetical protein [Vibrio chagasii]KAB0464987.1 hypothetical protein F7Q91_24580 [Vibrio chagasii]
MKISLVQQKINAILEENPSLKVYLGDFNAEEVERCFHGQSQSPERRAAIFIIDFAQRVQAFEVNLTKAVTATLKSNVVKSFTDTDEAIKEQVERFKVALKGKADAQLAAESRCISWHVTGPARFPKAKAEKANKSARDAADNISDLCKKAVKRAMKQLFPEGDGTITKMSSSNPSVAIKAELETQQRNHEFMKIANRHVPKAYVAAGTEKLNAEQTQKLKATLLEKGIPETELEIYMEPNPIKVTWGRFSTENSNAKIRRLKGRLAEAIKLEETRSEGSLEGELENGITYGIVDGRIAIWLGGKPGKDITSALRKFSLKFSPSRNNAWVRAHTANAEAAFKRSIKPFLETLDTSTFA